MGTAVVFMACKQRFMRINPLPKPQVSTLSKQRNIFEGIQNDLLLKCNVILTSL